MSVNPGIFYRECRERVIALVVGADEWRVVPATPLWNVHDVLAHLSGVAHDAVTGNLDGVTTDPWTDAQVQRGRSMSVQELVAQWQQEGPVLDEVFASASGGTMARGVIDVLTHEADLRNALGAPFHVPADALAWAADVLRRSFLERVAAGGLPPVEIACGDAAWFRGMLGRLTEHEVRGLAWSQPCDDYLDHFFSFGRAQRSLDEGVC